MEFNCEECGVKLSFGNISTRLRDVDGKMLKPHCKECGDIHLKRLKMRRFVEVYKGNHIYKKSGNFYPYWECHYYFKNLEDCRKRIDMRHTAFFS